MPPAAAAASADSADSRPRVVPASPLWSSLALGLASVIWGFAFVAQRLGMDHIGPFLFNGLRNLLGAATVWLVLCLRERRWAPLLAGSGGWRRSPVIRGGLVCGLALFAASNLQQAGLVEVEAAKAGFLTTLYIVLVPLIGLALGHRAGWNIWVACGLAVAGLYLLCLTAALTIAPGDLVVLAGAVCWAVHILGVGWAVRQADAFRLCVFQFLVCAVLSLLVWPVADPRFVVVPAGELGPALLAVLPALAFAGLLSSGVAFTCQAVGQRAAPPAVAALIMSLEAPFATLAGCTILGESLTGREALGCGLMFAAVLTAQLPGKRQRR